MATDFLSTRDRTGRTVPVPMSLVIRREAFAARFGGLQYHVRRRAVLDGGVHEVTRRWDLSLGDRMWPDGREWCFDIVGEHVSSPVAYVLRTDRRVGVGFGYGDRFQEIASSTYHLIEHHALLDHVSHWDPWPGPLEPWAPGPDRGAIADHLLARIEGLTEAAEASGPCNRWFLGAHVAVRVALDHAGEGPRIRRLHLWTRGETGRRQVRAALT
ncbi:hypothetical protein [Nocardiopsis lucentensis]|uniref:hypothetical protein n=1 Tax=Nocardiopsis lucentensis TaxID=53441 RepID=UPI00036C08F5|nr:hypothetical protein [Nocardiopsis lucentensis]